MPAPCVQFVAWNPYLTSLRAWSHSASIAQLEQRVRWVQGMRLRVMGHRRARRKLGLLAGLAALAALAAGCGNGELGSASQGGVFRLGSDSSIDSLNPFVA